MFKTLRVKLLAFFLLTTFIPQLFLGYISFQSQKKELTKYIEQSLLIFSNQLAGEIEILLAEQMADIEHLATNPVLKDVNSTNAEVSKQFKHFLSIHPIYSDTIFVKPDGIVAVSMIEKVIGRDLSERKWFHASKAGAVYISDIYLSPVLNEPILVMSAPVFDHNNKVIGVISPSFDLNYLWKMFNKFSKQDQIVSLDGYAFLINKKGDIIAHPDHQKILNENHFRTNNLLAADVLMNSKNRKIFYNNDSDVVISYKQINKMEGFDEDWFVGIAVSKKALFAPLQQLLIKYLLILGCVLFLTSIAVVKLSKYIIQPLEQLVAATSEFAVGKPVTPLLEKNTYEEFNRLKSTFITMTNQLAERDRSHKKSTLIIETTDNGVIAINKHTRKIMTFNRTCENLFSLHKEEVMNQTLDEVGKKSVSFQDFITESKILAYLEEEKTKKFEIQCMCNQKTYHFFISLSMLPSLESNDNHEEMLIVINDLTEKREMERELFRSEKLKVVGEIAAGLAHEIRNPLAIIKGFMQLFSKEEAKMKKSNYDIIVKEIDRVNHFVTDLLNIANPKPQDISKSTQINTLLNDLLILQNSQLENKGILLVKKLEPLPIIFTDPSKLQQVFINIIQNAVDAMKERDQLEVSTKHLFNEEKICIIIADTGTGMDLTTLEKLGTPFYTTKETGTGLGLTTSYRIIEEMNGTITVSSEVNKGSTFKITLPLQSEKNA